MNPSLKEAVFIHCDLIFKTFLSVSSILHCIGAMTSVIIFPLSIILLVIFFLGHKNTGIDRRTKSENIIKHILNTNLRAIIFIFNIY